MARKKVVRKTNERKRKQIAHKPLVAVVVTVGVVAPIGAVWALMHTGATQQVATSTQAAPTLIANQSTMLPTAISGHATGRTIQGPSTDMQWGPVQVTIVVKGNQVSDVSATAPTERERSAFINQQALPMLRQEVLQAKTVANIKQIYGISGATMTSEAFYQSLLSALTSAHLM